MTLPGSALARAHVAPRQRARQSAGLAGPSRRADSRDMLVPPALMHLFQAQDPSVGVMHLCGITRRGQPPTTVARDRQLADRRPPTADRRPPLRDAAAGQRPVGRRAVARRDPRPALPDRDAAEVHQRGIRLLLVEKFISRGGGVDRGRGGAGACRYAAEVHQRGVRLLLAEKVHQPRGPEYGTRSGKRGTFARCWRSGSALDDVGAGAARPQRPRWHSPASCRSVPAVTRRARRLRIATP
jgi:hypothetical protein